MVTVVADTNLVHLVGTLSRDPRIFDGLEDKTPFCQLHLEVTEPGIISTQPRQSWHLLKGFGKPLMKVFKGLFTGTRLDLFGRLQTRSYGEEGDTRYITEVVIDPGNLTILKAVTERADPMSGYDADAAAKATLEARIDHEVNVENTESNLQLETASSDESIPPGTETDEDDIPF